MNLGQACIGDYYLQSFDIFLPGKNPTWVTFLKFGVNKLLDGGFTFLQETWLGNESDIPIPNFNCIVKYKRPNTRAGGVAIYQNSSDAVNIITPSMECSVNQSDIYGTIQSSVVDLCLSECIHFQWIPSHINIDGNEIADSLAWAGAGETTMPAASLTYLELISKNKAKNKAIWMIPPVHPWYQRKCPGGSLVRGSSRRDPTALTRFLRGH
ncbi:RNase H domain-containing protein [Trichonephila clavipes]|nr:RNase H domain-containing protein [Trichonephila clavipes]